MKITRFDADLGVTVEDEGTPLTTAATTLDFVGAGVTASGTGSLKTITIPGCGDCPTVFVPPSGDVTQTDVDFPEQGGWGAVSLNGAAPTWAGGGGLISRSPSSGDAVGIWVDSVSPDQDSESRAYYLAQASGITPVAGIRLQGMMHAFGNGGGTHDVGARVSWEMYAYHDTAWATTNPGWMPPSAVLIAVGNMLTTDAPVPIDVRFMIPGGPSLWVQFFIICTATEGEGIFGPGPYTYVIENRYAFPAGGATEANIELYGLVLTGLSAGTPGSGQQVLDETPTPAPDGATTLFHSAFAYAPGTLVVRVDGMPQNVTGTSPSGAAFTLAWMPATGDQMRIDYVRA